MKMKDRQITPIHQKQIPESEWQPAVSALLLTIGESTVAEAHEALRRQTLSLQQILVVENVRPFAKAFNEGVSRIRTPFFIQCDADMMLDENCVEFLASKMTARTGMVVGYLRDPLQGNVRGVKLYRTECCRLFPMEDSSDCEEIFRARLLKQNWLVTIVEPAITLGRHDPDQQDLIYQFERFKFMGVKIRARKAWYDFAFRLIQLARCGSEAIAPPAICAMICGFHMVHKEDHLTGFAPSSEYRLWLGCSTAPEASPSIANYDSSFWPFHLLIGYRDGRQSGMDSAKLRMEFLRQSLNSDELSRWAYLLGFVSAAMNPAETVSQNFLTRSARMLPFLCYLRRKLNYHVHSVPV